MNRGRRPTAKDYEDLLGLRTALRHLLRWSDEQARAAGLTPAQHQLLLAIKGGAGDTAPTIGELADYLATRHHSVVGLIDRAADSGLVARRRDAEDGRVVHLVLTPRGRQKIEEVSRLTLVEMRTVPRWPGGSRKGWESRRHESVPRRREVRGEP